MGYFRKESRACATAPHTTASHRLVARPIFSKGMGLKEGSRLKSAASGRRAKFFAAASTKPGSDAKTTSVSLVRQRPHTRPGRVVLRREDPRERGVVRAPDEARHAHLLQEVLLDQRALQEIHPPRLVPGRGSEGTPTLHEHAVLHEVGVSAVAEHRPEAAEPRLAAAFRQHFDTTPAAFRHQHLTCP